MKKKKPSLRQVKYAYGLMNDKKSKYQIAIDAGFSPSTARVPKLIENKQGFSLAMAQVAGEMTNVTMKVMFELKARNLSNEPTSELLKAIDTMSKTFERFRKLSVTNSY